MIGRISVAILMLVALAGYLFSQRTDSFNGFALVDKTGNILKPTDHQDRYQELGTYFVLDPKGNQMHFNHVSPSMAEYYRKNRMVADGTVVGNGIRGTDHTVMTTGDTHWA